VIHGTAAPRALGHRFVTGARLVHVRSPTSLEPLVWSRDSDLRCLRTCGHHAL